MAQATIFQIPTDQMINFFGKDVRKAHTEYALTRHGFASIFAVPCELVGEAAAEEMFDLSNNPSREDEREAKWGRHRSLSVGDVVHVDGESFICASFGWEKL